MSIEAGGVKGWCQYSHAQFGIKDQFGFSAPASKLFECFGFTVKNLSERAKQVISFYENREAPGLYAFPRLWNTSLLHFLFSFSFPEIAGPYRH